MKKLLSLILALALVAGMVPATFATGTETETVIYSPTYVFKSGVLYNSDNTAATSSVLFKNMAGYHVNCETGNWKFVSAVNLHSDSQFAGSYATWMAAKPVSNNALVLSLDVDKSGVYSLAFNGFNTSGTSFDMPVADTSSGIVYYYIAHKDVVNRKGWGITGAAFIPELEDSASKTDAYADVKLIASYDRRADSTSGHINHTMSEIALKEGENYLFAVIKNPSPESVHNSKVYAYLRSLKLTCEATLDVISEGFKETYKVGDTFTLEATATDGSGNVDEAATAAVTYSSSNKNVATVDTDGNVAVVGEGYAEITAETTVNGKKVTNRIMVSIPVVWSPYYNFTRAAFDNKQFTDELGAASWSIKCATDSSMLNRNVSTGEWIYRGGTKTYTNPPATNQYVGYFNHATADISDTSLSIYCGAADSGLNATVLEITVDKDGYYKPTFDYYKYNRNGVLSVYLVSKDEFDARSGWDITSYSYAVNQIIKPVIDGTTPYVEVKKLGSHDTYDEKATSNTTTPGSWTNPEATYIKAGKYYLFLNSTVGGAGTDTKYLHVSGIRITRQPTVETTVSKTTLAVGDSATLTSGVTSGENQDITATTEVTYTSSDRNVVQVSGNTITAVGEGTATITATAANGATDTVEITVEKYVSAPKTLSLYVTAENGDISATVDGSPANVVTSVAQGAKVTVTANDTATHRFSCWMGTAGVASFDAEYTFNIYTNTALEAVYEAKPEENQVVVSFYKPNRELFATKVVDKDTTFGSIGLDTKDISLVGYNTFKGWAIGESENEEPVMIDDDYVITEDLGVVAVFEEKTPVTGISVNNVAQENISYGQPIVLDNSSAAKFRYWTKNGVVISYIKKFTHYAWQNDAEIKSVVEYSEPAKPVAVLESYDSDTWMFEYEIPENCARLEVGIIFGNSSDITVDSCYARAVSRRGAEEKHGQFTASSDYSFAKGYIIFKDNKDKVCVVYSK